MTLNFKPPLQHVCLLRLSAIGDTCHALAALRAFQAAWPRTRFTWIIGKLEAKLMTAILPEIEFITFDKSATLKELWRLRRVLRGRRFDLLLDLQLSFRASLISSLVSAPIKLGFDRQRARELQWWFTNARIAPATTEHVLDSFMGFARACGIEPGPPRWDIELPAETLEYARGIVTDGRPTLLDQPLLQPHGAQLVGGAVCRGRRLCRRRPPHAGGAGGRPQRHRSADGRRHRVPRRASSIRSARTRCRSFSG